MNRVLVICSGFPPVNATGLHRTLALVRLLRAAGRDVMVLTLKGNCDRDSDQSMLAKVPPGLRVIHAPSPDLVRIARRLAFWRRGKPRAADRASTPAGAAQASAAPCRRGAIDWCTSWLQFPDNRLGWLACAAARGLAPALRFAPQVIYSSAPMWSAHVLGMIFRQLLGAAWVADCRDPWRGNPYRRAAYRAHDRADALLERWMVELASAVVCNTPPVQRDFERRYPRHADKFITIPNGYDEQEIAQVISRGRELRDGIFRLVHAGVFYGPRRAEPYFEALAQLVAQRPQLRSIVRLRQVGPDHYEGTPLMSLAERHGVDDMLELTGPLRHLEALRAVHESDVALAASQDGDNGHFQVPRKFYEYYGLGKPILVCGGSCATIREMFAAKAAAALWLVDQPRPQAIAAALADIVARWQGGSLPVADHEVDMSERRMSRSLERVLAAASTGTALSKARTGEQCLALEE